MSAEGMVVMIFSCFSKMITRICHIYLNIRQYVKNVNSVYVARSVRFSQTFFSGWGIGSDLGSLSGCNEGADLVEESPEVGAGFFCC